MKNFNSKLFIFSVLFCFFAPSFLQAHPPTPLVQAFPPYPPANVCFNSSAVCQTFSGSICPLVNYAPRYFSACLTSGFFYFCYNAPNLFYQAPACALRGSPCICSYPNVNYLNGAVYYVYEHGFTL